MNEQTLRLETLLADIQDEDYDLLIQLQQLKAKGWQVYNVIDADIVGNYCFPDGIKTPRISTNRELTDEYITDEQATLYNLFRTVNPAPQNIILDEYVIELRGMTRVARQAMMERTSAAKHFVRTWVEKSERLLPAIGGDVDKLTDDVLSNYSSRIAEVLFGLEGVKKFMQLMDQEWLKFESGEQLPDFFQELFDQQIDNDSEFDRILEVFSQKEPSFNANSRLRDSTAIQRIIGLNKTLQSREKEKDRKHLFVFVIDAPSVILGVFQQLYRRKKEKLPMLDGKPLPLYLTTQQLFAHLLCKVSDVEDRENYQKTIEKLQQLKEISREIQDRKSSMETLVSGGEDPESKDIFTGKYENLFANYKVIRNEYENTGLFKNVRNIYKDMQKKLRNRSGSYLIRYFDEVEQNQNDILGKIKNRDKYLTTLVREITFNSTFIDGVEGIGKNQSGWTWTKGMDPIEGTYQILPVFLELKHYEQYSPALNKVIKMVLGADGTDDEKVLGVMETAIDKLKTVRAQGSYLSSTRLLKALVYLLLPDETEANPSATGNKDQIVFEWLSFLEDNQTISDEFMADLKYLLCWVARRTYNIPAALKYARQGMRDYPEDPRFYHGRALAKYCEIWEDEHATIKEYNDIIKGMLRAEELYPAFFSSNYNSSDQSLYMEKLTANNNNSICVFLTEKARIHFEKDQYSQAHSCLREARARLNKLKKNKKFVNQLSEYFDTESILEYWESFLDEEDIVPLDKLACAEKASVEAQKLTSNEDLLKKYRKNAAMITTRRKEIERQQR